jgi:glycosyltransferase involved in cell wall biosynthesis
MPTKQLQIVTPVFNDWDSFIFLLRDIDEISNSIDWNVSVVAIDDGSTEERPAALQNLGPFIALDRVQIATLATNVGHQRAIAIGLSMVVRETNAEAVIIMDSDGEDRPLDIPRLLKAADGQQDFAVVAQRQVRTNTWLFNLFYALYKIIFTVMTGKAINFGNFSLVSRNYAHRMIMQSDLWNNLPGALLKSRVPITYLPTDRGHRYAGSSKMNYISLIVHGMSGISVYSDVIFVRMLAATGLFLVASGIAILAVAAVRLTTDLATPGWATTVIFGILIILLQTVISTLMTMLLLLNNRNQKNVVPFKDYADYILSKEDLINADHQVPSPVTGQLLR